ncbi:MAG: hypothetical protein ACR2Q3_05180 [Woeseiaceae bacterium]
MLKATAIFMTICVGIMQSGATTAQQLGAFQESATVIEIGGEGFARNFESVVSSDSPIEWSVFVPDSYNPDLPAGVLVYISPSNSGRIPEHWQAVLREKNLIWVAANKSGNSINPRVRIAYSLLAPAFIDKYYEIDTSRIFIAGLSGGGRVASMVAPGYPTLFRGAVYICGANKLGLQTQEQLGKIRTGRFVFLTGSEDFNRSETKRAHKRYVRAKIENSLYLEIPGMGHENPDAARFAEAIAYLDSE